MKTAFIADCHIGNHKLHGGRAVCGINERCRLTLDVFRRAMDVAHDASRSLVVVCGDLFDIDKPEPCVLRETMDLVKHSTWLVAGNHDQSSPEEGNNALAPFKPLLRRYENSGVADGDRIIGLATYLMPYEPGDAREWLPRNFETIVAKKDLVYGGARIVATHVGLIDEHTPPWLRNAHDAIEVEAVQELMKKHKIDFFVAGNWHQHRAWSMTPAFPVVQIGALCPTGFDNPGFDGYGSIIVWSDGHDGDELGWTRIEIPGPRFIVVQGNDAVDQYRAAMKTAVDGGHQLFIRWKIPVEKAQRAMETMREDARVNFQVRGFDTQPIGDGREEAREAAAAARASYGGWEEALRAYVEKMALDASLDRELVFKRARAYLVG